MSHISHQIGTNIITDLTESCIVQQSGITRDARNDNLWTECFCSLRQLIIVDDARLWVHLVGHALQRISMSLRSSWWE